jgi:hypothetical protein
MSAEILVYFLCSGGTVIGLLILVRGVMALQHWKQFDRLQQTPGWIVYSADQSQPSDQDDPESVQLRYQYEVDGQRYFGTRIHACGDINFSLSTGRSGGAASTARKHAQTYPLHSKVMIHYDPARPDFSCLTRGSLHGPLASIIGGSVVVLLAAGLLGGLVLHASLAS